ncbi:prolyl endopeptidase-like [Rhopilema esculentum]|uniref:prolyl endopeptidase-like n=1 Tax=Rhopilema esculentum TaxID=499914 RepID=UPI0031DA5ED9
MLPNISKLIRRHYKPKFHLYKTKDVEALSWTEDLTSPRVQECIKAESRYANMQLLSTKIFQLRVRRYLKKISKQQLGGTNETGFKEFSGSYIYYEKKSGSSLPSIYRKHAISGDEQLLLDQHELALETGFVQLNALKPSPSGMFMAAIIRTDVTTEIGSCYIYNLEKSRPCLLGKLSDVMAVEWCNDNKSLIVGISSGIGSVNKIKMFCIDNSNQNQLLIENDPRFSFDLLKTRDSRFIIAHSNSKNCSEVHILDANNPKQGFRCLVRKEENSECFVDHWDDQFYAIRKGRNDEDYGISRLQDGLNDNDWQVIYTTKNDSKKSLQDMEIYADGLVLYELNNLIPQLTFMPFNGTKCAVTHKTADHSAIMESFSNQNPQSDTVRYTITSPIQPVKVFEYDRVKDTTRMLQNDLPAWNTSDFRWKLLKARSKDGRCIPMTVFFRKDIKDPKRCPAFITVYGSYGESVNMRFSYEQAFLLQNSWILAFPHVRGGGEFGKKWYTEATKLNKNKTFQDLQASVRCLHDSGFSNPCKTAIFGMSAGGLPVAVLCNEAPNLLQAAVLKVPFLDVLTSMSNKRLDLTSQEYEEWGNPLKSEDDLVNIKSYCPIQNLKASQDFPSVYLISYMDDERVPAWMPLKWLAKWRRVSDGSSQINNNLVLCRLYEDGGHFGNSRVSQEVLTSEMIAFLYKSLELPMKFC